MTKISAIAIEFYSNPAADELSIPNTFDFETFSVFGMLGWNLINVASVQWGVTKVNVSKLQKGTYVVVDVNSSKRLNFRMIR